MISLRLAILVFLLSVIVVACSSASSPKIPTATNTAPTTPTDTPNTKLTSVAGLTPDAAAALVSRTVIGARPILLMNGIPADWIGEVSFPEPGEFWSNYRSPDGSKSIMFSLALANPPDLTDAGAQSHANFHGDARGQSFYQIEDRADPVSQRELIWTEPGTWTVQPAWGGVPYYLVTTGLTDQEFWDLANSLHPLPN